jgi:hypothetical protein
LLALEIVASLFSFTYDFLPFLEKETSKSALLKPLSAAEENEFTFIFP